MKYLALLSLVFLVGCGNSDSAESLGIQVGKVVHIKSGFYKGCSGIATRYDDYDQLDDMVVLNNAVCSNNIQLSYIMTEAKNVK